MSHYIGAPVPREEREEKPNKAKKPAAKRPAAKKPAPKTTESKR